MMPEKSMFPVKHRGALHRALGVAKGKTIPPEKMAMAARSDDPRVRKMAVYARNMMKSNPQM